MIPIGLLSSSARWTTPPVEPVDGIRRLHEWDPVSLTTNATGPLTTVGGLVTVRSVHRHGESGVPAAVGEAAGGNVWHPVGEFTEEGDYIGVVAGGSGDLYMWYTVVEQPFSSLNVAVNLDPTISRTVFVAEWAGNATQDVLVDSNHLANPSMTGPLPIAEVTSEEDGTLIFGALGATVSNREFTLISPNYTPGIEHRSQQTTLAAASRASQGPGTYGPQWQLSSGGSSTTGLITAAFRPA